MPTRNYALYFFSEWKPCFLLVSTFLIFVNYSGKCQTTLLSDPGMTYTNSDGPTGPDVYSVDISSCTSISFSVDYSFSLPWIGSGNMESAGECNFGTPCAGDPNFPTAGSCNNCWDFLWAQFNLDGAPVGGDLIGDAGTTDAEQSGSIFLNDICTDGAQDADISIVTQTWAANETITFSDILIICWEAAPTITTNNPLCGGGNLDLFGSATDLSAVQTWQWTNTGAGNINNPTAQNTFASGPVDGEIYTLTTTDPNGCSGTDMFTASIISAPTASIAASPSNACPGDLVTFTFTGTPNSTVSYNDGVTTQSILLDGTGTASVTVTMGGIDLIYTLIDVLLGSCTQSLSESVTVMASPPPTASISVSPLSACEGDIITFTFTGTPNAIVTYNDGMGTQSIHTKWGGDSLRFYNSGNN